MTTTTDNGLEVLGDLLIGNSSQEINALAIGSATGTEVTDATSLGTQEASAVISDNNAAIVETGVTGESELIIRVKGGLEVPAGTEITEIGAFAGGASGSGTLIFVDNFSPVLIEAGHTEEFTIPVNPTRSA